MRSTACRAFAIAAATTLCASCTTRGARADEASQSWQQVERVVAFGDVHGAYAELAHLLQAAGVVDAGLHWSGGRTHLVSLGDLLDRGDDSRQVMDLLMRLQPEAEAAGGRAHVVLGNHEAMNLLGDLRYVAQGDYAAYTADEPPGLRERMREEWVARHGDDDTAFDAAFPPGYFGHRAAFAADGKYGRWLLSLPAAIIIDDTLFMHGGPSAVLTGMSLPQIDLRYRTALSDYLAALAPLEGAGLVHLEDAYAARADAARQRLAALPVADSAAQANLTQALGAFTAADDNPMLGVDGPNWYRGAALCKEASESDVLRPILEHLHVERVVIGHTVARHGRVVSRFDAAVIKLDTGMNHAVYGGHPAALLLEGGTARVLYADGDAAPAAIPAEPLYVTSADLADAEVAALLAAGTVEVVGPRAPDTLDVRVAQGAQRTSAVFVTATAETVKRELAAYGVDRMLQLGLVPATVERELQGQRGYLQARPERWVTQTEVQQRSLRADGWCAVAPQLELVYAFDALIGNGARTANRLLYDQSEWTVLLTGHDQAFGTATRLPDYLKAHPPAPGAEMRRRLSELDAGKLKDGLGTALSNRQREALLKRRDGLLAASAHAATP